MINYLGVKIPLRFTKNGTTRAVLPFEMKSIMELPTAKVPVQDKLLVLLEQAILTHYVLSANNGASKNLNEYLRTLKQIALLHIPRKCDSMDATLYARYRSTLDLVLSANSTGYMEAIRILNDQFNFRKDTKTLPEAFYEPYLKSASGYVVKGEVYEAPLILTPCYKKCENGECIVFTQQSFPSCNLGEKNFKDNPTLNYLMKLDWSSKNWVQFTDVLQSYGVDIHNELDAVKSVPGALALVLRRKNHKFLNFTTPRKEFATLLRDVSTRYRIRMDSPESLQFILEGMGYSGISALSKKSPTMNELASLENYSELAFLKPLKLQAAMEAADSEEEEEDPSKEEEGGETDPLENDPETDPESESGEGTSTEYPADTGEDPEGVDDLGGMEDPLDDSGSTDTGDGTPTQQLTDTVTEPEDPLSAIFKISMSETLTDYFYREAASAHLRVIVQNPPAGMSAETIAFLRIWLTQWINLVSADTTRSILSQLAVNIDV